MSNSNVKFKCQIQLSNSKVKFKCRLPAPNSAGPKKVIWARAIASPEWRGPKKRFLGPRECQPPMPRAQKKCLGPRDCQHEAFGSARACPQLMSFINVSHSCQISMSNINCQMKMSNSFNLWGSLAASNF